MQNENKLKLAFKKYFNEYLKQGGDEDPEKAAEKALQKISGLPEYPLYHIQLYRYKGAIKGIRLVKKDLNSPEIVVPTTTTEEKIDVQEDKSKTMPTEKPEAVDQPRDSVQEKEPVLSSTSTEEMDKDNGGRGGGKGSEDIETSKSDSESISEPSEETEKIPKRKDKKVLQKTGHKSSHHHLCEDSSSDNGDEDMSLDEEEIEELMKAIFAKSKPKQKESKPSIPAKRKTPIEIPKIVQKPAKPIKPVKPVRPAPARKPRIQQQQYIEPEDEYMMNNFQETEKQQNNLQTREGRMKLMRQLNFHLYYFYLS